MSANEKQRVVMLVAHGKHLRGAIVELDSAQAKRLIAKGYARPFDIEERPHRADRWRPNLTTR